jgi:hypothetical protein
MRELSTRRTLIGAVVLALVVGLWFAFKTKPSAPTDAQPSSSASKGQPGAAQNAGPVSAVKTNPVKRALRNSSWQIVTRTGATPDGPSVKLSLEMVRANFNAAGMRGVNRFAAFSPPQYAAIKTALNKREDTEISAAPDEFAAEGETVGFDLNNGDNGDEFSIDLSPKVDGDGQFIHLKTVTRGTARRRDGTLPIWDGQTVMVPLGAATGRRSIAAFVTVRLTGADGKPINDFLVNQ